MILLRGLGVGGPLVTVGLGFGAGPVASAATVFRGVSRALGVTQHSGVSRPSAVAAAQGLMGVSGDMHVDCVDGTSYLIDGKVP